MSGARRAGPRPISIDAERMRRITAAVEQLPAVDPDPLVAARRRNLAALGRSECRADQGIPMWLSDREVAALYVAMATAQQEMRELQAEGHITSRVSAVRLLELQIATNEMLPPELRCDSAIAEMRMQLARLQRRHLSLVRAEGADRNRGYRE
jgi:hypothetical protein